MTARPRVLPAHRARNGHSGPLLPKPNRQTFHYQAHPDRPAKTVRQRPLASPADAPCSPSASHSVVVTVLSALTRGFFLSEFLSPRRVIEKFLKPCPDRPTPRRLYPAHPAVQFEEHFPTVCAQLLLNSCRKLAALLLEAGDLLVKQGIPFVPGIVPGLEVVAQIPGQFRHMDRRPIRLLDAGQVAPSLIRCLVHFLGGTPAKARSAVVPVDEDPARLGHAVRISAGERLLRRSFRITSYLPWPSSANMVVLPECPLLALISPTFWHGRGTG